MAHWQSLEELVVAFEAGTVQLNTVHPPETAANGVISLGWTEHGDELGRLHELVYEMGVVTDCDWVSWYDPDRYPDVDSLRGAAPVDLIRLATAFFRSDRFREGVIVEYIENGMLVAVLRQLVDDQQSHT